MREHPGPRVPARRTVRYKYAAVFSLEQRVGVGENEYTVVPVDHAVAASHVAGHAGMSLGMDIADQDRIARFEFRSDVFVDAGGAAPALPLDNLLHRQRLRLRALGRRRAFQFTGRDQTVIDQ